MTGNPTILIIEDDDAIRENLAETVELHGFRVIVAENGLEGLAAAKRAFDLNRLPRMQAPWTQPVRVPHPKNQNRASAPFTLKTPRLRATLSNGLPF